MSEEASEDVTCILASSCPSESEASDSDEPETNSLVQQSLPEDLDSNHSGNTASHGSYISTALLRQDNIHIELSNISVVDDPEHTITTTLLQPSKTETELEDDSNTWLPYSLHRPFLISIICGSILLGILTLFLTWYSSSRYGLGDNNSSQAFMFAWRFLPTTIAVIYGILTTILVIDVRRTEVFARLSRTELSRASSTICFGSRSWWNDPFDAMSKKRHGYRSWALLAASFNNIISFMLISPLSAGLLVPVLTNVPSNAVFQTMNISTDRISQTIDDLADTLIFQTIAGGPLNTSTSAWIGDEYFVQPFWPEDISPQLGASFPIGGKKQSWTRNTIAYKSSLSCSNIPFVSQRTFAAADPLNETFKLNFTTLELGSENECAITITQGVDLPDSILEFGGGWWSSSVAETSNIFSNQPNEPNLVINSTSQCADGSFIFLTATQQPPLPRGYLCSTTVWEAVVPATVTIDNEDTRISVDADAFMQSQRMINTTEFNVSQLWSSFFSNRWQSHFDISDLDWQLGVEYPPTYQGPLLPIAGKVSLNDSVAVLNGISDILQDAQRLQQQWLGQFLLSRNLPLETSSKNRLQGQIIFYAQRLTVVEWIGLTIGILMLLSAAAFAVIMHLTRLNKRYLGLKCDPSSIATTASFVTADHKILALLKGMGKSSEQAISEQLSAIKCRLKNGYLVTQAIPSSGRKSPVKKRFMRRKRTQPIVLRACICVLFLTLLILLVAALVALYRLSQTHKLQKNALVYQWDLNLGKISTTLAPFSIIPTAIAVGVKLWYGAFEETTRRLQPLLSINKHPKSIGHSVAVEYANSPMVFSSYKAFQNFHWILIPIGIGALMTEICEWNSMISDAETDIVSSYNRYVISMEHRSADKNFGYFSCSST
jgi:hypothetical protein